jgi:hypothetical protein
MIHLHYILLLFYCYQIIALILIEKTPTKVDVFLISYLRGFLIFACAAASLAIGTLKGEQET